MVDGFSVPEDQADGVLRIGIEVLHFIAGGKQVIAEEAPDNILTQITGDLLGAFVPEADTAVAVHDVHAGLQVIEDGLVDFGVVQFGHTMTPRGSCRTQAVGAPARQRRAARRNKESSVKTGMSLEGWL
jgi:hypothetical protein